MFYPPAVETCAAPYTCLPSGVCGTVCAIYGDPCAGNGTPTRGCCGGLICDSHAQSCYIADGGSCIIGVEDCAYPYACLPSGTCGTGASCSPYAGPCATQSCCSGLSCYQQEQTCYVAEGGSCTGGETCAPPYTCLSTGICGGESCGAYNTSCTTSSDCCGGLACESSVQYCWVADGYPCLGLTCASPDTCLSSGYCGIETASCSSYGASCAYGVSCCSGFTCESSVQSCWVADGYPCGGGEACASPYTCKASGTCG